MGLGDFLKKAAKVITKPIKKVAKEVERGVENVGDIGQDAIDVARGKKDPGKIVKHWANELEDEVSKVVGKGLEISGDVLQFVGDVHGNVVKFGEKATKDMIKVHNKFIDLNIDAVDAILPDGPWRVDLGVVEIKSSESIDDKLRQYNEELSDSLNGAVDFVKNFYKLQTDAIDFSGVLLENLGYYIAASAEGFSRSYNNPRQSLNQIDKEINVSANYLSVVLDKLSNRVFKYGDEDKEYIKFGKISMSSLDNLNSLEIKLNDGIVGWDAGEVRGAIKIKSAKIQLIPVIKKEKEKFILYMGARLTHLNLDEFPPRMDEMIAWVIQDNAFAKPIVDEDLTEILTIENSTTIAGKRISKTEFEEQKRSYKIGPKNAIVEVSGSALKIKSEDDYEVKQYLAEPFDYDDKNKAKGIKDKILDKLGVKFPDPPVYIDPNIDNPDLSIQLSTNILNHIITETIGKGLNFPLNDDLDKKLSNDYVRVHPVKSFSITDRNTIRIELTGGIHFKLLFARLNMSIEEIHMEIVPEIVKTDDKFFFKMKSAMTSLKISGVPPAFEKAIANLIITKSLNKKASDITDDIQFDIESPLKDEENLNPGFKEIGIKISQEKISIVAKI